jgi:hypothetical protein
MMFFTSPNGDIPNERMRITSGGNVGIGVTDTQSFRLAVDGPNVTQGDANTTIRIFDTTSATTGTGGGISFGGYFDGTTSVANTLSYIKGAKENSTAGNFASYLSFGTRINDGNPSERMRITSIGEIAFRGSTTSANEALFTNDSSLLKIFGGNSGSSTKGIAFHVSNGSTTPEVLRITSDGNVGIGTTSPLTRLTVNNGGASTTTNYQFKNLSIMSGFIGGYASSAIQSLIAGYDSTTYYGTDIGYFYDGTGYGLTFSTNATLNSNPPVERMRITSGGNVGIGTASPARRLQVEVGSTAQGGQNWSHSNGTVFARLGIVNPGVDNNTEFGAASNNDLVLLTNNTERMRITLDGNLLVNTTQSNPGQNNTSIGYSLFNGRFICNNSGADNILGRNTDGTLISIRRSGEEVGSINVTSTATSYVTSSDYRLKEDLKEIKGLEKISALKVYDFKWKNTENRMDGVLAHELAEVIPYAVHGEKDGEQMQGVDYSKLVPVLVKAIQELKSENDILKSILQRNNIS